MAKTTPTVLESYKRANKERKAKMLLKYGYKTEAGFLKAFEAGTPTVKKTPAKKAVKKTAPVKATKAVKPTTKKEEVTETKTTDYVIAFDCTSSMNSYISSVKKHVKELVSTLFTTTPDLKIKIVAFGDYCDMKSAKVFGNAYQEIELTNDQNALINFITTAKQTGGGDSDEFYELVIKKINEETKWRNGNRAVLLIGDAKYHAVGYSYGDKVKNAQIDWKKEAQNAKSLGIQYDTLKIHDYINWYGELSQITGGVCMDFANANKISNIIEGTVSVRSNKAAFAIKSAAAFASGDEELIGAYKSMETLL